VICDTFALVHAPLIPETRGRTCNYHAKFASWSGRMAGLVRDRQSLMLAKSKSKQAARSIRKLIQETRGSLSFSPTKECRRLRMSLPLVSRQFKKLYGVGIRSYSRKIRMKTTAQLLMRRKRLRVDEVARILGYRFTPGFSRCFQTAFRQRPKQYQMRHGRLTPRRLSS
jgi:AraC-like DNA-binding protein